MQTVKILIMIVLPIIVIVIVLGLKALGRLVHARNKVDHSWMALEEAFSKRRDLIPIVIKILHDHNDKYSNDFDKAAQGAIQLASPRDQETVLSRLFMQLGALQVADNRSLIDDASFQEFLLMLGRVEDDIQRYHKEYNEAVINYNALFKIFPTSLISEIMDFEREKPFDMKYATERPPDENLKSLL